MFCVFIKELRQFRHSSAIIVLLLISAVLSVGSLAAKFSGNGNHILLSQVFIGFAHLFGGIFQLAVIVSAATRWKRENGDGSMDIIHTTPISPIAVACGKTAATSLLAFLGLLIPIIVTKFVTIKNIAVVNLLVLSLLQVAALSALSLGAAAFQHKKNNRFDFLSVLTVLAFAPLVSFFLRGANLYIETDVFICVSAGLIAATAIGIAFAVCGASPRSSDRAMPLKLTVTAVAVLLPCIYAFAERYMKLIPGENLLKELAEKLGIALEFLAVAVMSGALFERKKQTRRVLANVSSKLLFPFSTGVAGSFVLVVISGVAASLLSKDTDISMLAKLFFLTGLCQLTRDREGSKFPTPAVIVISLLTLIALIIDLTQANHGLIYQFVFFSPSPNKVVIPIAAAGAVLYTVVCIPQFRQYFCKGK